MIVTAALLLGACGSDDDSATKTTATTAEPTGASTTVGETTTSAVKEMALTSPAFAEGEEIGAKYACPLHDGGNASPELRWSGVPKGTATLVLVMFDPDGPGGGFTHWVHLMKGDATSLREGGGSTYFGPCAPPGRPHHYEFTLWAFGEDTDLPDKPKKDDIDKVAGEALASAKLTGVYKNPG